MKRFVEVIFNLPIQRSFVYLLESTQTPIVGCRVRAPFRNGHRIGIVWSDNVQPPNISHIKKIEKMLDAQPLINEQLFALARWMSEFYLCSMGEALSAILPSTTSKSKESDEGIVEAQRSTDQISLNAEQQSALQEITAQQQAIHYLSGVTGSGKSEVLLHAAEITARDGGGVLLLAPEISLAMQIAHTVQARSTIPFALLHSRLTVSQRLAEWVKILTKDIYLVIGVRSAIFAPLKNIKLIIVDEEQDGAYKSSYSPRFHARQIAMQRAKMHNATLVLASATPSLEAWHYMKSGKIHHRTLQKRVGESSMPRIEIVSLQNRNTIISAELEKAILDTVHSAKQVILLHNRRGYGHSLNCKNCGYTQICAHCTVAMIYHKSIDKMICHYCGFQAAVATLCPHCQSLDINFYTFGTERVQQELVRLFPQFRIARVDADTTSTRSSLEQIITRFKQCETDILIGTQLIAKGLNFRNVELVGIILADSTLTLPDFRAEEHTYMLLTQVAGRSGRFSKNGRVIIQTFRPSNKAIQMAAQNLQIEYYESELAIRRELSFPPFVRLIRLVVRAQSKSAALKQTTHIHNQLLQQPSRPARIIGPQECTIAKIASQYRFELLISDSHFKRAHACVARALQNVPSLPKVYVEVDIDPIRTV